VAMAAAVGRRSDQMGGQIGFFCCEFVCMYVFICMHMYVCVYMSVAKRTKCDMGHPSTSPSVPAHGGGGMYLYVVLLTLSSDPVMYSV